jgi:hypothetical protein
MKIAIEIDFTIDMEIVIELLAYLYILINIE